jgi:putative membrane protein
MNGHDTLPEWGPDALSERMAHGYGWATFMDRLPSILLVVFIILIVVLLVKLVRNSQRQSRPGPPDQTPVDILKTRYAKGEITKEEYEQIKRNLES